MPTLLKNKIAFRFFNPKRYLGELGEGQELALGTVIGVARKVVVRTSDNGEQMEGLSGVFEAVRYDDGMTLAAGTLYLPTGLQPPFHGQLAPEINAKTGEIVKAGATQVSFQLEVVLMLAGNPAGYEWGVRPLREVEATDDPLAELRSTLPTPALPKPVTQSKRGRKTLLTSSKVSIG